jgi:soluble lytic murein transglycosylase-like protein
MRYLVLCLLYAAGNRAFAGEFAVLASGVRMYVDRHEADAANVRLYHGNDFLEISASAVKGFEPDDSPPVTHTATVVAPAVSDLGTAAAPAQAANPLQLADAAADRYGLPRALVRSVMLVESGLISGAVSSKGAIGLMQLMPATARDLGIDPRDPAQNVDGGTRYLRQLLIRYDGGLRHALAAYNAGPAAVDRYHGIPPYSETIDYVARVERALKRAAPAGF